MFRLLSAFSTQAGGLIPLLELINSNDGNLQHNAAFALYGLADNPDNVPAFIREGAVQTLLGCQSNSQVESTLLSSTFLPAGMVLRITECKHLVHNDVGGSSPFQ